MTGLLGIKVLGQLVVLRDDREIALTPSKKTRALLAYLAVTNRRQRRDHLCQMFWDIPDDPRASLRWSLSKLRHIIDDNSDCLRTDRDSVLFDTTGLDVDLLGVAHMTASDVRSLDTQRLETAAALFRGRFLEDLELPRCPVFEAWRTFHGDALDRTRLMILQALVERLRSDPERALSHAETLQSLDPTNKQIALEVRSLATEARERAVQPPPAREEHQALAEGPAPGIQRSQEIHYCSSPDGVRIAYAVSGSGPPLLRAAHWMSHLQYEWESPVWRHWIDSLSTGNTLIRYDERGNGLSDWNVGDFSFDAMVTDLESVADASGLDRFPLLGVSQSCAISIAYAIRHRERVSRLILYGGYARGWRKRGDSHQLDTHEAMTTLIREGWGKDNPAFRQLFTETFIPGASREQMAWFNDLQRQTASPLNASLLHSAFGDMDVSAMLGQVSVPTLVLHARNDAAVPFEEGKTLAAGIPGARFVDLNSTNHILLANEPAFAEFLREVRSFMAQPE
ncbi:alpha/beta fold hydrolase [Mesorhizobium qingshengii]|uniref:DNA-binding transcriptional activator of the SARP family n=1 Tax=Mesorhizobium qingshengii TaxID=1165689 RepID=A0A1G5YF37_9HYPH|nr:alpha/beta fold hydrolase [Mesorhizobium qingshengii]SDA81163.1 DNA-binding transcriptional activator of the SARP family [Mesorhizobium qingshengii]